MWLHRFYYFHFSLSRTLPKKNNGFYFFYENVQTAASGNVTLRESDGDETRTPGVALLEYRATSLPSSNRSRLYFDRELHRYLML